ncbi:hypothetical protein [Paraburkholderia hospita]|uniref:hypothetical protein n=1 Tax=Paraburkholderia TaxID=1822464 RepID=UPI0002716A21|nr:hypothetical protein [Paraburkholderia hospita]EUC12946.1 hypothetical protein PMI06_008172 [Burkholderia sp. BT03]SKC73085.1 hypothetical protein SAMN06266956_2471 [Paraburkholderia hospita]
MSSEIHQQATRDVVSLLPSRTDDMARLAIPLEHDEPLVSVIGKYNHGKSRLLNELIGRDDFWFCRNKDGGSSK